MNQLDGVALINKNTVLDGDRGVVRIAHLLSCDKRMSTPSTLLKCSITSLCAGIAIKI